MKKTLQKNIHCASDMYSFDFSFGEHWLLTPEETMDYLNEWLDKISLGKEMNCEPLAKVIGIESE